LSNIKEYGKEMAMYIMETYLAVSNKAQPELLRAIVPEELLS
jgi:hypothetical protein